MITLSDGTITVTLHPDLYWSDENNWHPVEQTKAYTLTGALIVMSGERKAGRPITLEPEDDESAWMLKSTVNQLRNWALVAGKQLTLTLRGIAHTVLFRHEDGGLDARPVQHLSDVTDTDYYRCVVRLLEI
jgi:hypothetical protein